MGLWLLMLAGLVGANLLALGLPRFNTGIGMNTALGCLAGGLVHGVAVEGWVVAIGPAWAQAAGSAGLGAVFVVLLGWVQERRAR